MQVEGGSGNTNEFKQKVDAVVIELLSKLTDEYTTLYRRKADYITLISQLVMMIPNRANRLKIIKLLVHMWRDPDSEVRVTAIKMIKNMGEASIPEVLECFEDDKSEPESGRATSGNEPAPVRIMNELASLVNNEDYGEKDILQDLLKWRFSQINRGNSGASSDGRSIPAKGTHAPL
eukprot:jgi/Hompol1/2138/HPOL_002083-RA